MTKLIIKLSLFFIFLFVFSLIYKSVLNYSFWDCFYISLACQTFTGSSMIDKSEKARKIATVQMIMSYTLIAYFVYDISQI